MQETSTDRFHVVAVTVAADLAKVKALAKFITLEALNAKVLVARSGTLAMGFKPITDFMVSMSDTVIKLVEGVNQGAKTICRLSIQYVRARNYYNRLLGAERLVTEKQSHCNLEGLKRTAADRLEALQKQMWRETQNLIQILDDIEMNMRAADIISATSKIETVALQVQNKDSFMSVSDKLKRTAEEVRKHTTKDRRILSDALKMVG